MKTAVVTGDYPYYCANCGAYVDWPKWYPFCSMGCIRGWKEKTIREFLWQILFKRLNSPQHTHKWFYNYFWDKAYGTNTTWACECGRTIKTGDFT